MAAFAARTAPALTAAGLLWTVLAAAGAAAQDAAYFSPTYAASQGSPYSEVYAQTFGQQPLETAAPAPVGTGATAAGVAPAPSVVYVIEGGRLLTYSAENYRSGGDALTGAALPEATPGGRLYGAAPPAAATPALLLPQRKAP